MPSKKSIYSGVLNEPMTLHYAGKTLLCGEPSKEYKAKCSQQNGEQFFDRVLALFEHYKIEMGAKDAAFLLALALARDHVPGFSYKKPEKRGRGRPRKWDEIKMFELYADVKDLAQQGHSALNACRILAENQKYAQRYGGETQSNLHRRYLEGFKNLNPFIREIVDRMSQKYGDDSFIHSFALRENRE